MPRLKEEVASRYYSKLPRRVNLLNADRFLACIRHNRSGNRKDFKSHYSTRAGLYGFTPREWKRVAGPYVKMTGDEALEHLAYRWFIHCWHECLLNRLPDTPYNVAVFWETGDKSAPRKIRSRTPSRFASQIATLYNKSNAI